VVPPEYNWEGYGFETRQLHAGEEPEANHGARITPIYLSNAFRFDSFDQSRDRFAKDDPGHAYSRNFNPTNAVTERRITSLEGGTGTIVAASGMAAINLAIQALVAPGDHFAALSDIYSGTRIVFDRMLNRQGVAVDYIWDQYDSAEWQRGIGPETKAIFAETVANPRGGVADIAHLSAIAQAAQIPLIIDNTTASPYLTRPLELGADLVVHSATKFLSGSGSVIAGAIVDGGKFNWEAVADRYPGITQRPTPELPSFLERYGRAHAFEEYVRQTLLNDQGPGLSPFNGFLLLQGIETLSLRMERHTRSAYRIATHLASRPEVLSVDYAGLPGHRNFDLAKSQCGGWPGSVFAFTLHGGLEAARRFIDSLRVFSRMTNIGDTRSMALHPATTTHASFPPELRQRMGIGPGLIRLSIGLETPEDLLADLDQALDTID
jgi:O-acetylhomoserine (thiol)-lyase